jgi:hypothetical protein
MSLAHSHQLSKLGKKPMPQVLLGGVDRLPSAIEKTHIGELSALVGGCLLMAGTVILNIIEYHNSNNVFINNLQREKYELIDQNNVSAYLPFLQQVSWSQVNFAQFCASKTHYKPPEIFTVATVPKAFCTLSKQR